MNRPGESRTKDRGCPDIRKRRSRSNDEWKVCRTQASRERTSTSFLDTAAPSKDGNGYFVPFLRERDRMNRLFPTNSTKSSWNPQTRPGRKSGSFDMQERDVEVSSSEQSATPKSRFYIPAAKAALSDKFLAFLRHYDDAREAKRGTQLHQRLEGRPRFGLEYILYHGIAVRNHDKLLPRVYEVDFQAVDKHSPGFLFVKASKRSSTLAVKREYSDKLQLNPVAPQKNPGYTLNFSKLPNRPPLAQVTEYHKKSSDSLDDHRIKEKIQAELYSNMKIQDSRRL